MPGRFTDGYNPYPWMSDINWQPEYRGSRGKLRYPPGLPESLKDIYDFTSEHPHAYILELNALFRGTATLPSDMSLNVFGHHGQYCHVEFVNNGQENHTFTSSHNLFDTGELPPSQTVSIDQRFFAGYWYPVLCSNHENEHGIILVQPGFF